MIMEFLELAYETYQNAPGIIKQNPVGNAYYQYADVTNTFQLIVLEDGPDKDVAVFCFAGIAFWNVAAPLFIILGAGMLYQNYF